MLDSGLLTSLELQNLIYYTVILPYTARATALQQMLLRQTEHI